MGIEMEVGVVESIAVRCVAGADFSREIGVSDVDTEERFDDCGSGSGCDEGGIVADGIVTARSLEITFRETCSVEDSRVGKDVQLGPTLDAAETVWFVGDPGETR
jgi:hypothetical protein